jgi:hypothetical protein
MLRVKTASASESLARNLAANATNGEETVHERQLWPTSGISSRKKAGTVADLHLSCLESAPFGGPLGLTKINHIGLSGLDSFDPTR